jgi:glutathione peroxidase
VKKKRNSLIYLIGILFLGFLGSCKNKQEAIKMTHDFEGHNQTIYQFSAVPNIQEGLFDFSKLKGKKILIVNTASKCGLTYQYEDLEALYKKYQDSLEIIGFPSNDFMGQEPGTHKEIATFCKENYGVTFPIMAKVTVKGKEKHPIYQFLTEKSKNGLMDSKVKWNFQKYLIGEEGNLEKVISPKVEPFSEEIIHWIENKN